MSSTNPEAVISHAVSPGSISEMEREGQTIALLLVFDMVW
jgi:hypothetical protein